MTTSLPTYVLYVGAGREAMAERSVRKLVPAETYEELYYPRFEKKIKHGGVWRTVEAVWVPGYLFVATNDVDSFRDALWAVPTITRILDVGVEVVPLSEEETVWLERFTHPGERTVGFSEGVIVGNRTIVTTGPLAGLESYIVKIDRHKRFAWLAASIGDHSRRVKVGLEIVSKVAEPLPRAA